MVANTPILQFFTRGTPVTKGSLRFWHKWRPNGHCATGQSEVNDERLKQWRALISTDAARAMKNRMPFDEPLCVALSFYFERPAVRAREMEPYAWGGKRWDVDKLARACLDALTDAACWTDDSNVAVLVAEKRWASEKPNGVLVSVSLLREASAQGELEMARAQNGRGMVAR